MNLGPDFFGLLLARLINRQVKVFAVSVGAVHNDSTVSVVGFKGQSKCSGCHEATDHSCGNGCALSGRFH